MNRSIVVLISGLTMVALSACAKPASNSAPPAPEAPKISSETVVKVTADPVEIKAGQFNEAVIKVVTQGGYHINANPATFEYLKATELDLPDTTELLVDYIYYPNPQVKKFSFSEQPLRVYEGETQLKVMLNAEAKAAKGSHNMPAKLNVQACDDKVCYPPGSIAVNIPVTIK